MSGEAPRSHPGPPGDLDRHLFSEGRHRRLWEVLGAHSHPSGGVSFCVWAPNARAVSVLGDWNGWVSATSAPMEPVGATGLWWTHDADARVGHRYKYEIITATGDTELRADPLARRAEVPPGTASIIDDALPIHDAAGLGDTSDSAARREARTRRNSGRMSVYEVHLGSWRRHPDGRSHSARELAEPLAEWVVGLGFTHVEFMPVATHPYGGSWGYQVSGFYAPDARLGSPGDLRHLIDTLHRHGLGVILDWVPAHFPRDRFALARFDGTALYEHADPRRGEHPDWGTLVFNHGRHEVRNFLVANALYWLECFEVDGLRVDAVASMLYRDYSRGPGEWVPNEHGGREDHDAIAFLQELNEVVAAEHPGALVVAEESTAWPGVTAPVAGGGLGFSRKWNLGWMHDTLSYFARDPVHRSHHHSELTLPMTYARDERWVLPLSHDEVVHGKGSLLTKMPGDEWQQFANLRALLSWQWCHPGPPLLFMGGEFAQVREWAEQRELDWWLLEHAPHDGIRRLVADLNRLQVDHDALWRSDDDPDHGFGWLDAHDAEHSVASFWRSTSRVEPGTPPDLDAGLPDVDLPDVGLPDVVLIAANLTPVPRHGYRIGAPAEGRWQVVFDSDAVHYGGSGHGVLDGPTAEADRSTPWQGMPASLLLSLPPLSVVVLARAGQTRDPL